MIAPYVAAMRRYVDFTGRASRSAFWWFHLALIVLTVAAMAVDAMLASDPEGAGSPLATLVLVVHVLPALAVGVRRLHDAGRSGWWWLVGLVPLVGPILLLVWYCRPGTPGDNRFGPDPLATSADMPASDVRPLAAATRDVVAEVERLAGLRASGALSEAEFGTLKARVMTATSS